MCISLHLCPLATLHRNIRSTAKRKKILWCPTIRAEWLQSVSLKKIFESYSVFLKSCCFIGKSNGLRSKDETKSTKGKSLAATNSNKNIQKANGIAAHKEAIKMVPSATVQVIDPISYWKSDENVWLFRYLTISDRYTAKICVSFKCRSCSSFQSKLIVSIYLAKMPNLFNLQ